MTANTARIKANKAMPRVVDRYALDALRNAISLTISRMPKGRMKGAKSTKQVMVMPISQARAVWRTSTLVRKQTLYARHEITHMALM